ncbi:MAG: GAF domain-containing protein [Rhodothermaceae bacterium]|nr:GAF domain-containing protein [Rhodothermaceae bacterium]
MNDKQETYDEVFSRIKGLIGEEDILDWVGIMATVACELHTAFSYYHWTGFYRVVQDDVLLVGPYQGSHGCLSIPFSRGVCGAAARTRSTQLVRDVNAIEDHIACSSTTQSEIVVPIITPEDRLIAVLDVDSDDLAAFDAVDQQYLEALCKKLGQLYASRHPSSDPVMP